jgi:hypothetical protein
MRNINQRLAALAQLGPKHGSVGLMIFSIRAPIRTPHLVMNNHAARKRVEVSPAAVRLRKVGLNAKERERRNRRAAFRPSRISKRNAKRG